MSIYLYTDIDYCYRIFLKFHFCDYLFLMFYLLCQGNGASVKYGKSSLHIQVGIDSGIVCAAGPAVVPCLRRRHDFIQDRRTDALYGTAVCPGPVIDPAFIEEG